MHSLNKIVASFVHASDGIREGLGERNMQIHIVCAFTVTCAGFYYQISTIEWGLVFLCFGLVTGMELFNSAIEKLADVVRDSNKLGYKATKLPRDMAAGAVLVAAFFSACVGLEIFLPKIFGLY